MPKNPLVVITIIIVITNISIVIVSIIVMISDNVSGDYQYRFPCDTRSARPSLGRGVVSESAPN
jgi:hypothetical protein